MERTMVKEKIAIRRIRENSLCEKMDEVAVEQQVCISLSDGREIWVTCTPSYLAEMVAARKYLAGDFMPEETVNEYTSVKCGLFAKENLTLADEMKFEEMIDAEEALEVKLGELFWIAHDYFENAGPLFTNTGCAHSCALIYEGNVVCCIEDIGRHNALDKVIGYALLNKIPFSRSYVFTSGRISADYLQKVIDAGFPMVVSRAAVTANAVTLAKENNITLLGFIRKNTGNLYWEGAVKIGCDAK